MSSSMVAMDLFFVAHAVFSTVHILAMIRICFPSGAQTTSTSSTATSELSPSNKEIHPDQERTSSSVTQGFRPKCSVVGMFSHELHMHWMMCLWNLIVSYVHVSPHTRVHLVVAEIAVRAYRWSEIENLRKLPLAYPCSRDHRPLSLFDILLFQFTSDGAPTRREPVSSKTAEPVPVPLVPSKTNGTQQALDTTSGSKQTIMRQTMTREASDDSLVVPTTSTVNSSWRHYISMFPYITASYSKKGWGSMTSKISLTETSDDDSERRPSESSLPSAVPTPTTFRLKSVRSLYRAQLGTNYACTDPTIESTQPGVTNTCCKILEHGMRHFPPEFRVTVSATKPLQDTPIGVSFRKISKETAEIQISEVSETGLFGKSKLRVGHTLLSINGIKCPSTCQEAAALVKETKGKVTLVVGRNYVVATIEKDGPSPSARHAGIQFGVSPKGIFIKHIDQIGPFGGGCLRRGMRVTSIGGVKCRRSLGVAYALIKREGPMTVVAHDE